MFVWGRTMLLFFWMCVYTCQAVWNGHGIRYLYILKLTSRDDSGSGMKDTIVVCYESSAGGKEATFDTL